MSNSLNEAELEALVAAEAEKIFHQNDFDGILNFLTAGGNLMSETPVWEDVESIIGEPQLTDRPCQSGGAGRTRFTVLDERTVNVRYFNMRGHRIRFQVRDPPNDANPILWFKGGISDVLDRVTADTLPSDQVGLVFRSPNLDKPPAYLSFRRRDQLHIDVVWDMLSRIMQSNATIFSDGNFEVELTRVRLPVGRGRPQQPRLPVGRATFKEFCSRRRGMLYIDNVDNLCLPRALVVARAGVTDKHFKDMVSNLNNIQTIKARKLVSKSGVIVPDEGCGIPEMRVLQQYLRKYNITVYEHKTRGRCVIFEGVKESELPRLNILHHDGHYSVIRSLTVAFTCDYYCEQCHTPYSGRGNHRCGGSCPCCYSVPPCTKVKLLEELSCRLCARGFRGAFCFENHRTNGTCDNLKRCKKCFISTRGRQQIHVCGEVFCKLCRAHKPRDHRCYMQVNNSTPDKKHLFRFRNAPRINYRVRG